MKSVLPFRGDDTLMYSITYDLVTPESAKDGGYEESGYVVEPSEGELQDILLESNRDYGIYKPVGVGVFVNPRAVHDQDYFEHGHEKYYTLTLTKDDGTKLNQEELDFITALLNEGKYTFDSESNRFYDWGGVAEYGIGGWIGGTLIGGFLGYQIGKAVGYGRAYRGYESGGDIPSDYFDFQTVQYNNGGRVLVGRFNEQQLKNKEDKKAIEKAQKESGLTYIDSKIIKKGGKMFMEVYLIPDKEYYASSKFDNGGRVEYFDREDFYNKNPRLPRRIEISKSQYIKNKDFISKQKWARNIVDTQGYEDNNGVEFIEFDIEVNEKSSWDMWGWINENIPSSERKIFVQDKRFLEYSEGGEVRYFNRHENMGDETRGEILEYTNYPILHEYYGADGKDDTEYKQVKARLEEVDFDKWQFKNSLYGMFDGYDYTKTKDFQDELAKIKKADPKFHSKIMRIVEEIQSYPTTEQPNNNEFGLGGLLLAGGFGAYVGYKIGRARPQKKGFDTEKKVAKKVKDAVKDVTSKKQPAKAYAGGGKVVDKFSYEEDEIRPIGKYDYYGDEVELIAFNYPSRADSYDMESGYIFIKHPKGIEYESSSDDHLISNLLTHETVEDATNIFNLFKDEWGYTVTESDVEGNRYDTGGSMQEKKFKVTYIPTYDEDDLVSVWVYANNSEDAEKEVEMEYHDIDMIIEVTEIKAGGGATEEVQQYNYLYLKPTSNGLVLELTEEGVQAYNDEEIYEMYDLFEDINSNSEWSYIDNAGDVGLGLTDAPVITDGYYFDDDGEFTDEGVSDSRLYVWNDYMIKDLFDTLMEQGQVTLFEEKSKYYGGGETITKPRPTITPTETPTKPDKDNPYLPKVKPKPKASNYAIG